ncbi:MAG: alpha/beta hydrolase [Zunongwangia sp.]|uniref:alpha/beta fold hydrolase n=1 Tax=Zunongwangia sp. TaxID=1965325 RepID=UPI00324282D1
MSFIETTSVEKEKPIKLFYEDYGKGKPVILIHGWPLSHRMWEYQIETLVNEGFRVIAYDRRGFGDSDKPWEEYNYDILAKDLHDIIEKLTLTQVSIIGFSMGGGEVARYIGKYGTKKLLKAGLISAVPPYMLKTKDNPEGIEEDIFEGFKKEIRKDRAAFLENFGQQFVNFEENKDKVSKQQLHYCWTIATKASAKATLDCIDAFGYTDFREDLKKFDIPTLVVHGDADEIVPIKTAGEKSDNMLSNSTYKVIEGGPHGIVFTHKEQVNKIVVDFLKS